MRVVPKREPALQEIRHMSGLERNLILLDRDYGDKKNRRACSYRWSHEVFSCKDISLIFVMDLR